MPSTAAAYSPLTLAVALNDDAVGIERSTAISTASPEPQPLAAAPLPDDETMTAEPRVGLLVFRVGPEMFAAPLADVDEAIELDEVTPLPEMPAAMLGVLRLRGALLPLFSPAGALGVSAGAAQAALVIRQGSRRVAVAVDDVADVIVLREADLRATPDASDDRLLIGVAHHAGTLVSALDMNTLVASFGDVAAVPE